MLTPKHVLQVYHNVVRHGPGQHTAAARRELSRWSEVILADSGVVEGGTVVLSEETARPEGRFASCDLVVLNDYGSRASRSTLPLPPALLRVPAAEAGGLAPFSLFGLREHPESGLELYLRYAENAGWIGRPRRGDFKLADLRPGRPVRVRINGKSDFRRERLYLLAEFVFEYLGRFSSFEVRPEVHAAKRPPVAEARVVDLTEILY